MIVQALLSVVLLMLNLLMIPFGLITFPSNVLSVMSSAVGYIAVGFRIVATYTHFSFLLDLFAIALSVGAFFRLYHLVMWILRKIPFLGIS